MSEELENKEKTEENSSINEEDFNTDSQLLTEPQDSLAISRAKAAYGKKSPNTVRERRIPQRVVTADYVNEEPYEPDDIDDDTIISPDKGTINKTYKSSLELKQQKTYINIAESVSGDDVLALQSADSKSGQTISFKVKGIQWKAGFSNEFTKTPLGHSMHPIPLPGPNDDRPDALKKTGIVIRPVNPKLQKVLSQLLPASFKKEMIKERKKRDRLKQLAIYYLPSTQSSSVGFIHEYIVPRSDGRDAFYLYVQTSVGKAPVAILDEVLRTLEAGLPEGEKADVYDYTQVEEEDVVLPEPNYKLAEEVNEAMKQVSSTLNDSVLVHSVRKGLANTRNFWIEFMKQFDKYLARFVRVLAAIILILMNSLPMRLFIQGLRLLTKGIVKMIWGVNGILLAIARSPITAAILKTFGKGFSLLGGLFGAVFSGFFYFFKLIGKTIASIYFNTVSLLKDPKNFDLGISFPGRKLFDVPKSDKSSKEENKKGSTKIKVAKKAQIAKPKPKPNVIKGTTSFSQVTKPNPNTAKKPVPPKVKGSTGTQQIVSSGSNESTGKVANTKTPGSTPLGYFEDEPF
ncbi:MAG: hypothetical protein KatS3mg068_0025 [Candidatus Sericytochromatia bacterium]|nr:MAG: hypothetical protein KatS3mg068_0025 [Candidatus Sericytochromatia bacterium]